MRRFMMVIGVALLVPASACMGPMRVEQTLQPELRELTAASAVEVIDAATSRVLVSGTFQEAVTDGSQVERTATLTSPANTASKGVAKIEVERDRGLAEEVLLVQLEDLPYPMSCKLKVDGFEVVMFSPPADGKVDLKLRRRVAPAARTVSR